MTPGGHSFFQVVDSCQLKDSERTHSSSYTGKRAFGSTELYHNGADAAAALKSSSFRDSGIVHIESEVESLRDARTF